MQLAAVSFSRQSFVLITWLQKKVGSQWSEMTWNCGRRCWKGQRKAIKKALIKGRWNLSCNIHFEKKVAVEYNSRFIKYGAQPKSSLWFSRERQNERFDTIIYFMKKSSVPQFFSINDIGCGYGAFLEYLLNNEDYHKYNYFGYDVSCNVIEFCKKNFLNNGVFYRSASPKFATDFIIMSGTFNFFPLAFHCFTNFAKQPLFVFHLLSSEVLCTIATAICFHPCYSTDTLVSIFLFFLNRLYTDIY